MTQYNFENIDPYVDTGVDLAADLNGWKDAVQSCHKGNTRPAYAVVGTLWINDTADPWRVNVYNGTTDTELAQISSSTRLPNIQATSAPSETAFSYRNKLINHLFTINQRAYTSGTATSVANQYTLDRWRVVTSGQNLSYTSTGNYNTVTAPSGGIEQVIEGNQIAGGTYTLSWGGTATGYVNGNVVTNGAPVAGIPAATNVNIKFANGTVSKPQFEQGARKTPCEDRPVALELILCQRYYEKSYAPETPPGTATELGASWGNVNSAEITLALIPCYFKVYKRATPTITFYNTSTGGSGTMVAGATSYAISSAPADLNGFQRVYSTAAMTAGTYVRVQWVASAEL